MFFCVSLGSFWLWQFLLFDFGDLNSFEVYWSDVLNNAFKWDLSNVFSHDMPYLWVFHTKSAYDRHITVDVEFDQLVEIVLVKILHYRLSFLIMLLFILYSLEWSYYGQLILRVLLFPSLKLEYTNYLEIFCLFSCLCLFT